MFSIFIIISIVGSYFVKEANNFLDEAFNNAERTYTNTYYVVTKNNDNFKEIKELTGLTLKYKSEDEIREILNRQGFEILYCESFYEEMKFNTPLELLAHMKNTGVNSLSEETWTVKKIKDFCDKFNKKYGFTTTETAE